MFIVAALFAEDIALTPMPGPSTRIDLTGIRFSQAAPEPFPLTMAPHLVVMLSCPPEHSGTAALVVEYRHRGPEGAGEVVARNAQPVMIEPGRFAYRLVRAEIEFDGPGVVEAHCRVDDGPVTVVPFTLLPPLTDAGATPAEG